MKEKFNKVINKANGLVLAITLFLITGKLAFAQSGNLGQQVVDESKNALSGLLDSIVSLLQVVMGLGAIVVLAMVVFKMFKGDREAAEKLAWWLAGLTIGFVLLAVVARLISGAQSANY